MAHDDQTTLANEMAFNILENGLPNRGTPSDVGIIDAVATCKERVNLESMMFYDAV